MRLRNLCVSPLYKSSRSLAEVCALKADSWCEAIAQLQHQTGAISREALAGLLVGFMTMRGVWRLGYGRCQH
jgi:hypothetical protein